MVSYLAGAGKAWERNRFAAPLLRDTLLDAGAIAETLETAATWTNLPKVYDAVRRALRRGGLHALGTVPLEPYQRAHAAIVFEFAH